MITIENLTLAYQGHPAIHHLDINFKPGSLTAIVGPNGAGKSTLLKGISGELNPSGGFINFHGISHKDIAYLPQQVQIDTTFPLSVFEFVASGAWSEIGALSGINFSLKERILQALKTLGMFEFADRMLNTLSGGQFQRILFARLLVQNKPVILLDEPFNHIDEQTAKDLLSIIASWNKEKRTILAALHDMNHVKQHFPQTLILARECIAFGSTENVLTDENFLKARKISESFDANAPVCMRGVN